MKPDIHPKYHQAEVHCGSCGIDLDGRLHPHGAARRRLQQLPPVLHGQADDHRHGRPGRALPEAPGAPGPGVGPGFRSRATHPVRDARRQGARPATRPRAGRLRAWPATRYGGQALIEGVLMRGRDAIAVALRHPDGRIVCATERLDSGFHGSRWAKLPFVRGLVVLYETLVVGTRWLVRSANVQARRGGRGAGQGLDRADARLVTLAAGIGIFFLLPLARRDVRHGQHRQRPRPAPRRGAGPGRDLPRLPRADRPHAGHPARLPVPRRRAHDDPRPRGRRPAHDRAGPQVPDRPPALRHGVPRRRHRPLDRRVQPGRAAGAAGHGRQPGPAHPGHRRGRLRDPALGCQAPRQPARPLRHAARDLASR